MSETISAMADATVTTAATATEQVSNAGTAGTAGNAAGGAGAAAAGAVPGAARADAVAPAGTADRAAKPAKLAVGGLPEITAEERESLRRQGIILTSLNEIYNWGRANSVWPLQFGLACCAIEMIAVAAARFDIARFGAEVFRPSPRQADLLIVSGTVTKKMAPQVIRIWNQMPEPKYCLAMGACSISGGPFKQGYNVLKGIDRFIPVDVYVPGCPPRPEALLNGLIELQKIILAEKLTGDGAARHLRKDTALEYPVPEFGAHDIVPARNAALSQRHTPLVRE